MKKILISLLFIWIVLCPVMALEKNVETVINIQIENGSVTLKAGDLTHSIDTLVNTTYNWTFNKNYEVSEEDCGNFSTTCTFNVTQCDFYNATIQLLDGADYEGLCKEDLSEIIEYFDSVYFPKDQQLLQLKANVSECNAKLENKDIEKRNLESIISYKKSEITILESGIYTLLAMLIASFMLIVIVLLMVTGKLNNLFRGPRK